MRYGDIDDLLVNIDENPDEVVKPKEPLKAAKKSVTPPDPRLKKEKKDEKTIDPDMQTDVLSYLEEIDSNISTDENDENKEIFDEETSGDFSEDIDPEEKTEKDESAAAEEAEIEYRRVEFILRGTRTWNTREPYIIPVNYKKLNDDYTDLSKSFYFVKDQTKETVTQGEMKRAMFKFIRMPERNIIEEYTGFFNGRLSSLAAEISIFFGFLNDKMRMFVYHLGVLTLYKIIISIFQDTKSGYCFKLLEGNSVVKYIPMEFVKEMILKWHNDNIIGDNIPYDGIIEYNELKRQVSKLYMAEYEKYNNKLDEIMQESNLNADKFDREQLFKTKWDEWFGKNNIFVYNRFLERTIFKNN